MERHSRKSDSGVVQLVGKELESLLRKWLIVQ